tara:strand:+ start:1464 stop:2525 length:1062 start_codon:yes stop_codon:yes gene_type:complete
MNRFFKFISVAAIVGSGIYLLLEIFKLRNKIKLLEMELKTTEQFNSDETINDTVIHTAHSTTSDPDTHTDTIHSEILEYEKELEQVDQLINNLNTSHSNKITEETDIELEQEDIDLDHLEININKLAVSVEDHSTDQDVEDHSTDQDVEDHSTDQDVEDHSTDQDVDDHSTDQDVEDAEENQENKDTPTVITQKNINDIQIPAESNGDLVTHYTQKYSKKNLQDLCGLNKISKKGTKKDLILKLLAENILDTDKITASIDVESNTPQQDDTEQDDVQQDDTEQDDVQQDDTDSVAFNEVSTEHTTNTPSISDAEDDTVFSLSMDENIDTDSMLYKLKQFNQRSNHDDSIHLHM